MKRALVLSMVLSAFASACGMQGGGDAGDVQVALLEASAAAIEIPDPQDLLACLDLPEWYPIQWVNERLHYHDGCFHSWVLDLPISDCEIAGVTFDGKVMWAGDKMANVPRTGLFIRARALDKALVDLVELSNGQYLDTHLDVRASGEGVDVNACGAPVPGGLVLGAGVEVTIPQFGVVGADGLAQVSITDDPETDPIELLQADYSFAVSADLIGLPAVTGELTGTGIERRDGVWCPDAGQIRFTGTVGEDEGWAELTYTGGGTYVIELSDEQTFGPYTPDHCVAE